MGIIQTQQPDCANPLGSIRIDSIYGGVAPYTIGLNEQPTGTDRVFNDVPPGDYLVIIEDAEGCRREIAAILNQPESITLNLGNDRTFRPNEAIPINAQTNAQPPFTILWQPSDFLDCDTCLNVIARPLRNITYSVTVIDDNDCVASDSISLQLFDKDIAYAPNAFSPNGDGINDFFIIYGGDQLQQIKVLRIFDRWGELVFERANFAPNDEQRGWDGTLNGKNTPLGVYVFYAQLEVEGEVQLISGEVNLVR